MIKKIIPIGALALVAFFACNAVSKSGSDTTTVSEKKMETKNKVNVTDTATFGAGCFWCVETLFAQLKGVDTVLSGYSGGQVKNPSYKEVCNGTTGHAEAVQIAFDSSIIAYTNLLEILFSVHNPTTLNQQGADMGTQYRSAIFYHNQQQKAEAEAYISQLDKSGVFDNKIVTEVTPFSIFYVAEDYHQDYYNQNGDNPYCQMVVRPKVEKFQKNFKEKIEKK